MFIKTKFNEYKQTKLQAHVSLVFTQLIRIVSKPGAYTGWSLKTKIKITVSSIIFLWNLKLYTYQILHNNLLFRVLSSPILSTRARINPLPEKETNLKEHKIKHYIGAKIDCLPKTGLQNCDPKIVQRDYYFEEKTTLWYVQHCNKPVNGEPKIAR